MVDGMVTAVVGTHTHVQTADESIFPKGTAYITDIGMTGPMPSVIGMDPDVAIRRSLTQMPLKMEVIDHTGVLMGVIIEADPQTGKAVSITRVRENSPV